MADRQKAESPCTGECRWEPTLQYCLGGWRNSEDIAMWSSMSDPEQALALRRQKSNKIKHLGWILENRAAAATEKVKKNKNSFNIKHLGRKFFGGTS